MMGRTGGFEVPLIDHRHVRPDPNWGHVVMVERILKSTSQPQACRAGRLIALPLTKN